ncbi:MAG: hypothetical protein ACLFTL_08115, partial [Alphaproteobacteria bacterium]
MAQFEPDTSFARRRRERGGAPSTLLAAVLADTGRAVPKSASLDVFTRAAANGHATAPADATAGA